MRKAEVLAARMGVRPRGDGKNALSLLLPNGSRIVGLPGTEGTVRGFSSVSLMVIDEAARVPDDVYKALRPMLAVKNGDLWLLSTPAGKQGFFYENWEHGGAEWEKGDRPGYGVQQNSQGVFGRGAFGSRRGIPGSSRNICANLWIMDGIYFAARWCGRLWRIGSRWGCRCSTSD